jgi:hypothetical protein
MNKLNQIAALGLIAFGMTFMGCMEQSGPTANNPQAGTPVVVKMNVAMDPVNSLAKGSLISLKKLIIVVASTTTPDTVRDTILTTGSPHISATSTTAQSVGVNFTLKPLRSYTITATTKDNNDSTIHTASTTSGVLLDGDTAIVTLPLTSRFSMYQASVLMPDSLKSTVAGTSKEIININRIVMLVDGNVKKDTTDLTQAFYVPKVNAVVNYDYVPVGSHTIILEAFGPMVGPDSSWPNTAPLYTSNAITVNVTAGTDFSVATPDTLFWTGPTSGTGFITAQIGKVGTVVITAPTFSTVTGL